MTCLHSETFTCHRNQRCSVCYVDAVTREDGTLRWPAQEHPLSWNKERIAAWFRNERIYRESQGCDGFEFSRQNLLHAGIASHSTYGYIWILATLDLDYEMAYLLDVRRHDGDEEQRQYLFVTLGHKDVPPEWHPTVVKFGDDYPAHARQLSEGLRWFADRVDSWLKGA